MSSKRYTDEFKVEAAKQVIDQGRPVREVAGRLTPAAYAKQLAAKAATMKPGL